jgi:hypothetical protein
VINANAVTVLEVSAADFAGSWAAALGEQGERYLIVPEGATDEERGEGLRQVLAMGDQTA